MAVTLDDLKGELKASTYGMLTGEDDTVGERSLEKARVWLKARLAEVGVDPDESDSVVRQILLKYALYELYSYAEQEAVAADKKDDALELISGYINRSAGAKSNEGRSAAPSISVSTPERE